MTAVIQSVRKQGRGERLQVSAGSIKLIPDITIFKEKNNDKDWS